MLGGGGEPDAIVFGLAGFVAKDEDDFVFDVDCEAAEHGAGARRDGGERVEDEFVRDGLAAGDGEGRSAGRRYGRVAAGLWHRKGGWEKASRGLRPPANTLYQLSGDWRLRWQTRARPIYRPCAALFRDY